MSASARKNTWGYRHPRTTQERRVSNDKFDLLVRAKRRNLPNSYSDIARSSYYTRKSWKSKRKTQYKVGPKFVWQEFAYDYFCHTDCHVYHKLMDYISENGYFYRRDRCRIFHPRHIHVVQWCGPEIDVRYF